jgi:hypothetical protein
MENPMKHVVVIAMLAAVGFPALAERDPERCAKLRAKVERIDAQARQRSTTNLQLKRQKAVDEMHQLRCSRMGR